MNEIYKNLRKWIDICEKYHTVPGITFFTENGDKTHILYSFQLFLNSGCKFGITMGGVGTLDIPVEKAVMCLRYDKQKLDNDLKHLKAIKNKIQCVLGDVPITKELEDLLTSLEEGIDKYKYLKAATPIEILNNN